MYCLHLIVTLYYFKDQAESISPTDELHEHGHQNNNNDRSCLEKRSTLSAVNDYNKTITKHNDKKDTTLSFDAPEKDLNIIINTVDIEQKTNLKVVCELKDASAPSCVASMGLDVPVIDVKSLCLDNVAVIVEPNEFEVELTQDDSRDKEEDANDKVDTMVVDGDARLKIATYGVQVQVQSLPGINFVAMSGESSQEDSQNSESLRDESELENMLTKKWSQDARQERNKKIGKLRSRKHKLQSKSSVHDQFVDFDRSKEEFENSSRKARIDTLSSMNDDPIDDISENIDIVPMKLPRVDHGYDNSDYGNSKEAEDLVVAMDRTEQYTERINVSDSIQAKLIDEADKDTTASGVSQKNEMIESEQRPLAFQKAHNQTSSPLKNLTPLNKPGGYIVYYIKLPTSLTYHCFRLNKMQ